MTLEVEQQLGMEIRKLTTQIQVRRVGTLTKANFGVGGGEGLCVGGAGGEHLSDLESSRSLC